MNRHANHRLEITLTTTAGEIAYKIDLPVETVPSSNPGETLIVNEFPIDFGITDHVIGCGKSLPTAIADFLVMFDHKKSPR